MNGLTQNMATIIQAKSTADFALREGEGEKRTGFEKCHYVFEIAVLTRGTLYNETKGR